MVYCYLGQIRHFELSFFYVKTLLSISTSVGS
jgi:hypothetical protein